MTLRSYQRDPNLTQDPLTKSKFPEFEVLVKRVYFFQVLFYIFRYITGKWIFFSYIYIIWFTCLRNVNQGFKISEKFFFLIKKKSKTKRTTMSPWGQVFEDHWIHCLRYVYFYSSNYVLVWGTLMISFLWLSSHYNRSEESTKREK